MSKVGILTLGLRCNYGGILQAAALYNFLKDENFDPVLIRKYPIKKGWRNIVVSCLERIPLQNIKGYRLNYLKYLNNINFFNQYISNQTNIMFHKYEIENYLQSSNINSLIVGSDQVWRYNYINDGEYDTYFLNFNLNKKINKIAYAASFGIDKWEISSENLNIHNYLSDFSAISVRENSAKVICEKDFKISDVEIVLDPTLLVDISFYLNMIKNTIVKESQLITYILDKNQEKEDLINREKLKYNSYFDLLNDESIISIEHWVSSFYNADFIITDSFHGMVFSILFNKQFIVILNQERGTDRFNSLCEILDLKDRLLKTGTKIPEDLKEIDYDSINHKLFELRKESREFLLNSLKK